MRHWQPPLNLTGIKQPYRRQVLDARKVLATGAEAWARERGLIDSSPGEPLEREPAASTTPGGPTPRPRPAAELRVERQTKNSAPPPPRT